MDASLLSFGQQNQWQYLSNLSKQKGGVLMNTHCNGHLNLTISTRSYVHLYDVFLGAITDTCTYKYGILVLIFVLWFLFGFGFFLFVSVETCSDILKGLQKKVLTHEVLTHTCDGILCILGLSCYKISVISSLGRAICVISTSWVLAWIWHSINSSPHSIATCNLLITDTRWQTYRRFHTVFE